MLDNLSKLRTGWSKRESSWDRSGGNGDYIEMQPGETKVFAEMKGPGVVRHIWLTLWANEPDYLRRMLIRAYWDGEDQPSIDCPVGDFFGVGHGKVNSYSCAVMDMSAFPNDPRSAFNSWWPMPFADGARFELVNECKEKVDCFYWYVDWQQLDETPQDHGRFHAKWRRENLTDGWVAVERGVQPRRVKEAIGAKSLTDEENYLVLEAKGRGHFVGCNLSVHVVSGGSWNEGDDMFMIDGRKWPPDLHGTGTEDYFCQAWGWQDQNAFPYAGVSYHKHGFPMDVPLMYNDRMTYYRYHVQDPVIFHESLRFSIEHGHANVQSDDYSSVAYWYQTEPHFDFAPMLPVEARIPLPDIAVGPAVLPGPKRTSLATKARMERGLTPDGKPKK
jgi:hypothetical protein